MNLRCESLLVEVIVDGKKYCRDELTGVLRYTEVGTSRWRGASGRKVSDRHTRLIAKIDAAVIALQSNKQIEKNDHG